MSHEDDEAEGHRDYERRVPISEAERMVVAGSKLAVNDALNETYAQFGVARGNQESMNEFRSDLVFIRSIRQGSVKAGSRFLLTIVTLFAGGVAYGFVDWARHWLTGKN